MKILATWHAAVEPSYRKLFEELSELGLTIRLVVPSSWTEGGRNISFKYTDGSYIHTTALKTVFSNHIRPFFYPNFVNLISSLNSFKPDLLHIMEEPFSFVSAQFLILKRIFRPDAPAILFSFENIDFRQRLPYSLVQRYSLSHSDVITVVPKEGMSIWEERGFMGDIIHIPLGIDTDIFRPYSKHKALELLPMCKKRLNHFTIGYIGRLCPEKGIETLIDAAHILKDKKIECDILIVGNGSSYMKTLKNRIHSYGLGSRFHFMQAVTQETLPLIYSVIDTLILPSVTTPRWKEQFGRVAVEAMACKTPVIGSSSGEIPEVIGDAGIIFPEKDAQYLALSIERLIKSNALRDKYIRLGVARVSEYYSWKAVAKRYKKLYLSLINP